MFYNKDNIQLKFFRELLGEDLVFMNLSMRKEEKMKRLLARHGGDENTVSMFDVSGDCLFCHYSSFWCFQGCEKAMQAGGDEGDMVQVLVTADMTREKVVEEVLNTEKE